MLEQFLKLNILTINKLKLGIPPGIYYNFVIEIGLRGLSDWFQLNDQTIKIIIGIDDLPLTKSSQSSFWTISK